MHSELQVSFWDRQQWHTAIPAAHRRGGPSRPWPSPATGKRADATDTPFDEVHLEDAEALAIAIENLLAKRPHLASRRPTGDIGQGPSQHPATVDLSALVRQRAQ